MMAMRMTNDHFRDMQAILQCIAPEVTQAPYIVWQANLPGLPSPVETSAYATPDPSPATRQALRDAGLWRGPAPAVVFVSPLDDRWEAYGRFAHELGHLVPFRPAPDTVHTPVELETDRHAVAAWAAEGNADIGLPRWAPHHGRQYVRIAAHLWYRTLELCCLDIPKRYVLHHEYDLSPLDEYVGTLMPELRSTDPNTPIADILAMPEPDAFQVLFDRDKDRWLRSKESTREP
jgi:hypothetical protein